MASLPSVVLGFLAGIVFAPLVAEHLVAVLLAIPVIPFVLMTFAQLWQQAPPWLRPTIERLRVPAALLAVPTGVYVAVLLAPAVESMLFAGDFKNWLAVATRAADDPDRGSPFGGWLLISTPFAAMAAMFVTARLASGWRGDTANLRRFGFGTVAAVAIGCGTSALLSAVGLDLRDSLFGTFDPRNSLVVGLAMGFAVVPIIYTIAEDALSAVPDHLRAASLGAGATPWQTAVRVIFPTAMSGVFSAVMIGLGRAVGETMIVVMAVGGTPIMDISVFNGFRTLSANIATELPEAVRDSSHYRMLYLAALCLFAMTFVLNTAAEVVRQRFRRRAFQL
ncbi:MAG: ABC transporter permease subunit [Planctomycetes bacterium]|nr:ABC transporter permease subunit [Planctomycetota bacterium]